MFKWFRRTFTNINDKLSIAASNGDLDTCVKLIRKGADIHTRDDLALRWAALFGRRDVVKFLVENDANIHAENDRALRWAARNNHFEIMKLLVENGANIHADNDEALRLAAERGHLQVVDYLRQIVGLTYKCYNCLIKSTCLELCDEFNEPARDSVE